MAKQKMNGPRCDVCGSYGASRISMFCPDCKETVVKCSTLWRTASETIVGIKSGK